MNFRNCNVRRQRDTLNRTIQDTEDAVACPYFSIASEFFKMKRNVAIDSLLKLQICIKYNWYN